MANEFKLQDPGEGIHEAEIREVHVAEGDQVEDGDTLLTIETDKAATEVPAPFSGTVEEIRVREGDVVQVGDVLVTYTDNEDRNGKTESKKGEKLEEKDRTETDGKQSKTKRQDQERADKDADREEKQDKQEAKNENKSSGKEQADERKAGTPEGESRHEHPVPASPATRRLARELEIDLREVEPSGPEGRVTAEDIRAAAGEETKEPATRPEPEGEKQAPADEQASIEQRAKHERRPAVAEAPPLPDFEQWGPIERQPLRSIRRATAREMALSWSTIPHVMHQDIVDITALEQFRREHTETVNAQGGRLTLTVLVMKALVAALKQYPRFNASLDPDKEEIILKHYYHLGVAVDTERGLLVPVVRDVDRKSISELAVELADLAERTRNGKVSRENLQGGTFTLTNPGPLGGTVFTPIIKYPQAAILGLAQARLEPVVHGNLEDYQVTARLRLPLCLAFDHRLNDGAGAARFVRALIEALGDPDAFVLMV